LSLVLRLRRGRIIRPLLHIRRAELRAYLGAVCDDVIPRLRAADDVAAARYKGVVQGAFGHVGEISALRTLFERQASG